MFLLFLAYKQRYRSTVVSLPESEVDDDVKVRSKELYICKEDKRKCLVCVESSLILYSTRGYAYWSIHTCAVSVYPVLRSNIQ